MLTASGVAFTEHAYTHDAGVSSYGLEAAQALGVDPGRVFKTLMLDVDHVMGVAIVPVAERLDLKAAASALGGKHAVLAEPAAAQRATGYVLGGISPFGQRKAHPTVLDESALAYDTVYVSGGRRGFDVEVAPADLVRLLDARVAAIARG